MPRSRPPRAIWLDMREATWKRDSGKCTHCGKEVSLQECHIDHVKSGKNAGNETSNLRTLCRRCHVLRGDFRHRGMLAQALIDGIIEPGKWKDEVWWD